MIRAILLLAICLSGCAGSLEQSRAVGQNERKAGTMAAPAGTPERCAELDSRATWAGAIGKGAAALAGGAGLAALPIDPEDKALRIGVASGAVVAGAVAAASILVAESSTSAWARECTK